MPPQILTDPVIKRPEIALYDLNKKIYDVQEKQLKTAYLPKFDAFVQGAYGRPTLNFIDDNFGGWVYRWCAYDLESRKSLHN